MSKKKGKIKLKLGHFYNVRDGSKKGHPGRIYNLNSLNGEYDSIITETTYRKGLIPIHQTDDIVKKSYIKPNPFKGTRNVYGDKEYKDMRLDNYSLEKADKIKRNKYIYGSHYKKKHKIKKWANSPRRNSASR